MESKIVTVTPDMAKQWLEINPINRKLRQSWVSDLANMLRRGEWITTHQGIAFDDTGALIDGQHRLSAIVMADMPVEVMVTRDIPREAFKVLDRGKSRSLHDLTGHGTHIISVVNVLGVMIAGHALTGNKLGLTYDQYGEIYDVFGAKVEYMDAHVGHHKKGMASAPVIAAAVIRLVEGHDVGDKIRAMTNLNFSAMSPAIQSFVRQVINGDMKGRDDIMARAWRAFDPKGQNVSFIRVSDPKPMIEDMRAIVIRAFEAKRMAA
jgi:hypothetical protein